MKELEFGTAGIRGILGTSKENLNIYHVARVIEGFAKYLNKKFANKKTKIVVIGRDNRRKSREFSRLAAMILANYKINVLISRNILATPIISYSAKYHKAVGAINITASHNPKEYNGIKLYDSVGSQILPEIVKEVKEFFSPYEFYSKRGALRKYKFDFKNKFVNYIPQKTIDSYLKEVIKIGGSSRDLRNLSVAYSPQHGTGAKIVKNLFDKLKVNAFYEKDQMKNDPEFSHTKSPNPEDLAAYEKIIELGKRHETDLILTTDPDADRVGIGIWKNNNFVLLNGNETAILIFNYLIEMNKNKLLNKYLIYSFVSSSLPKKMAISNSLKWYEVATGFKYIGNLIEKLKLEDPKQKLLFAFEESYGSLIDEKLAYDKDAIQSSVILTKMASYYKKQNKTLLDVLENIYEKYGFIKSESISIKLDETNSNHLKNIKEKFEKLKFSDPFILQNFNEGFNNIAPSDMLRVEFENGDWISLRPSGTEAKIKFYIYSSDRNKEKANEKYEFYKSVIDSIII